MRSVFTHSILFFSIATMIPAVQAQSVLVDALVKHWTASEKLTIAVAEAMPDSGYSFKATDAEMTFGRQINHIAQANGHYCSIASGASSPVPKDVVDTKSEAIKNVTASYEFCISQIKKLNDSDLGKMMGSGPARVTAFEGFWGGFTHAAHHRGQAEVYLRLKGVTPPEYVF